MEGSSIKLTHQFFVNLGEPACQYNYKGISNIRGKMHDKGKRLEPKPSIDEFCENSEGIYRTFGKFGQKNPY
jgi:hypothetical protein